MLQRAILLGFRSALVLPLDQSLCRRKLSEMPPPPRRRLFSLVHEIEMFQSRPCFNDIHSPVVHITFWRSQRAREAILLVSQHGMGGPKSILCMCACAVCW
jgi:hypothetical protein